MVCDQEGEISPHHHRHTGGRFCRDQLLVPLCLRHHNELHYNEAKFVEKHFLNREGFNRKLEEECLKNMVRFTLEWTEHTNDLLWVVGEFFARKGKGYENKN